MIKRTAILAAAAVALSACTTTTGSIDTAIKTNLPKTCSLLQTAHTGYVAAAASGDIKASTIAKEQAYAGVQTICVDPSAVTAAKALVVVAAAYAAVSFALKEALAAH